MKAILDWLKGKKTYIVFAALFIIGGLQANGIEIPQWVYSILAALGLGALRAGVKKAEV